MSATVSKAGFTSLARDRIFSSPTVACTVVLVLFFVALYVNKWVTFYNRKANKNPKQPPFVPYIFPYVGNAVSLFQDPPSFFTSVIQLLGSETAFALRILNKTWFLFCGPENIPALRKCSSAGFSNNGSQIWLARTVFNMPQKAQDRWEADKSGVNKAPSIEIQPKNRIDFQVFNGFYKLLAGEKLVSFFQDFVNRLDNSLVQLPIYEQWTTIPDFMDFWLPSATGALLYAFTGDLMECINPNFHHDFLEFMPWTVVMTLGLPQWCLPRAHAIRRTLVANIKQWQTIARRRFRECDIAQDGSDPWWGSQFMRERYSFLSEVDDWDEDAIAALDAGQLWGANANTQPMALWCAIYVFRTPGLLERVRKELADNGFRSAQEDWDKLMALPLLQAVCAETLRLRNATVTLFTHPTQEMHVNEWRIPKDSTALLFTQMSLRDPRVWNTRDGRYPLDQFWADRFLAYPGDANSGPLRPKEGVSVQSPPEKEIANGQPKYVEGGSRLNNAFIPWGVGDRLCPGRFLAKRIILTVCAELVWRYDMEILDLDDVPKMSIWYWSLGTERPQKKVPFRVRLRDVGKS